MELMNALVDYESKYRHPLLSGFDVGKLYDIYPEKGNQDTLVGYSWPEKWPYNDRAGVYAFLDENLEVLYIGKSSMNNSLGSRLGKYVRYNSQKRCELNNHNLWKGEPRYVVTIAVPDTSRFEAASLEEYLISHIQTTDNKNGI